MIRLTRIKDGKSITVNPEHIILVWDAAYEDKEGTAGIDLSNNREGDHPLIVSESPEEVTRKILEYKLAMASYSVYLADGNVDNAVFERNYVKRLAGLEE